LCAQGFLVWVVGRRGSRVLSLNLIEMEMVIMMAMGMVMARMTVTMIVKMMAMMLVKGT
jgi:hypothetical protein